MIKELWYALLLPPILEGVIRVKPCGRTRRLEKRVAVDKYGF